jgi:RNA polymerase sigma-70 factor (ECF subfamily)
MAVSGAIRSPTRINKRAARVAPHEKNTRTSPRLAASVGLVRPTPTASIDLRAVSDEQLLSHYRDTREPEAFAELYRRYFGELGRYLTRYLGHVAFAEDVLQDTFLQVHAKCDLYRDGWPARPWLYTVATHRAVDALRRSPRLPTYQIDQPRVGDDSEGQGCLLDLLAGDGPGPLEQLQENERRQWVRDSVARLSELLRQALVLAYDRELSYADMSEVLDIPLGTAKSRVHCAVARLRAMAERYDRERKG